MNLQNDKNYSNNKELSFNLLKRLTERIVEPDNKITELVNGRLDSLTKPVGSLGRLEKLARQICEITGVLNPDLSKKLIVVMAADHGVVDEGVSAYPREVTAQMVYNFLNGGAAINVLTEYFGTDVVVVDAGTSTVLEEKAVKNAAGSKDCLLINKKIDFGTKNMVHGPAMTEEQAYRSIELGIEVAGEMINKGYGIIGTGDMGIGNTTSSSAIAACICGVNPDLVTGYGTGISEKGYLKKIDVINKALLINNPRPSDGIDVLAKIGGFEIGAIAGTIIGCASKRTPVVIDGFISGAGALIADVLEPKCRKYMVASHCSVERGHKIILERLSLEPLFNFDMRLGEGTGAAIGIGICEASIKILNDMATFKEAGVSTKDE